MVFKLYLELGSRVQGQELLELIRFPAGNLIGTEGQWSARWWGHGHSKRMRSRDREKVLEKLATEGCNEFELKWSRPSSSFHAGVAQMLSFVLRFDPSPTSELWAPIPKQPLKTHADELNRLSFQGAESVWHSGYRLPYPSILESWMEIAVDEKAPDDRQLQDISVQLVRSAIGENLQTTQIFGYGCVHGTCRRMTMTHSMGGVVAWMDQLGDKFENLYPIMLGPVASCQGLGSAIGDAGSMFPISPASTSAILSVNPSMIQELLKSPAVRQWLVSRTL